MTLTRHALYERQLALIHYYLDCLDDLHQMYARGRDWAQEALRHFDQEWLQLQTQQKWLMSIAHRDERAAQLVIAFPERARTLIMQIDPREAAAWLDDALVCVVADDFKTRYELLLISHDVQKLRRDKTRMREILDDLEALANHLDDDALRAHVACLNAEYYDIAEDHESQLAWAERALMLALREEDQQLIADAHRQVGSAYIRLMQYARAAEHLDQALPIYQQMGQRLKEALTLNNQATNAYYMGHSDDAVQLCEQALAIVHELGDRTRELNQLSNLAIFSMGADDLEKSLMYGQRAWKMARETGNRHAANAAVSVLIVTAGVLGLADELNTFVGYAREFLEEVPLPYLESVIESALSELAYEMEDWYTAAEMASKTVVVDHQNNDVEREYQSSWILGNSLVELERLDEAVAAFTRCLELYRLDTENPFGLAGVLAGLSYVEIQRGNRSQSQQWLDEFLALASNDGMSKIMNTQITLWNAVRAASMLNDPHEGLLREESRKHVQSVVNRLTDERLRTSFLSRYSVRSLMDHP